MKRKKPLSAETDNVAEFIESDRVKYVQSHVVDETAETDNVAEFIESDTVKYVQSHVVDETAETDNVAPFIKFEDVNGHFKPCYMQLESMTRVDISGDIKSGIFTRFPRKPTGTMLSYCECCDTKYSNLQRHLQGFQHRMFAITESNYSKLDSMLSDVNREISLMSVSAVNCVEQRRNEDAVVEISSSHFTTNNLLKANGKLVDYSSSETSSSILHSVVRQFSIFIYFLVFSVSILSYRFYIC